MLPWPSRPLCFLTCAPICLGLLGGLPEVARALTPPDASYELDCDQLSGVSALPAELACDTPFAIGTGPVWEGERVGLAEAYVGVPAFDPALPADVRQQLMTALGDEPFILLSAIQVETTITTTTAVPESEATYGSSVGGAVALEFWVGIEEIQTPPIALDEVPVRIRLIGEARVESPNGIAILVAQGTLGSLSWEQVNTGELSIDEEIDTEFFAVEESLFFQKLVQCQVDTPEVSGAILGATADASCTAVLDPVFELDQARFDALAGASTFPLEDYYVLRYSPNVPIPAAPDVPALPHVGAIVLLAGALLATGLLRTRAAV